MRAILVLHARTIVAVAFATLSCGGQVQEDTSRPDASVFGSVADGAASRALLGPIIDVPEGYAMEGYWYVDTEQHDLLPEQACSDGAPKRFWVAPFRLMRWEVTNAAFAACVSDGACSPPDGEIDTWIKLPWTAPSRANHPVGVRFPLARRFCQHYGGDVVTGLQWNRAASGDSINVFGIATLTRAWKTCFFDHQADPLCDVISQERHTRPGIDQGAFRFRDVGAAEWDVGPFGHQDLFGNADEWTRTPAALPGDPDFCALADGSADPSAVLPEWPATFARNIGEHLGWLLAYGFTQGGDARHRTVVGFAAYGSAEPHAAGIRCAFPAW